ncbi:CBN-MLTN-13 protein, partial [Aphelenchoides avenae]
DLGDYVERVDADRRRHQRYFAKLHGKNVTASNAKANANDPVVKEANNGLRILSPKLFSLIPDSSTDGVLSPNLLNLQEAEAKDGQPAADSKRFIASLPSLLQALMKNRRSREGWLNFLMEISGMGEAAERLASRLDPLAGEIQQNLPKAEHIASSSKQFVDVLEERIRPEQKEDLKRTGFSFFDDEQLRRLKGQELPTGKTDDSVRGDPDDRLEAEIRRIARMADSELEIRGLPNAKEKLTRRTKRQGEGNSLIFFVLEPQFFYFHNALRVTAFNGLVLSPFFFTTNYLAPEFFNAIILSPIIFEANLGYAQFFFADILSPYIFQANLLSPMFFDAFILSPEIFTADLLSPRILSPRVGSSQILTATLLSPNIGSPAVFSDDEYVIDVLSPNILSPDTRTHDANFIDILSPDILSGGEEDLDKEDQPERHKGEEGASEHKHPPRLIRNMPRPPIRKCLRRMRKHQLSRIQKHRPPLVRKSCLLFVLKRLLRFAL